MLERLENADLATTEAVVTEAEYLLDFSSKAQVALMHLLASGRPRVETIATSERPRIEQLMSRYQTLPMDYADATLVLLAERMGTMRVFTLDRRDFGVYRVGKRRFEIGLDLGRPSGVTSSRPRPAVRHHRPRARHLLNEQGEHFRFPIARDDRRSRRSTGWTRDPRGHYRGRGTISNRRFPTRYTPKSRRSNVNTRIVPMRSASSTNVASA